MLELESPDVGLKFKVEDKATPTLNKIEKAYKKMLQVLGSSVDKLSKVLASQSDAFSETTEKTEEARENQEKAAGKFKEMTKAIKQNWLGLDELGISWERFIKILKAVSVGAIIVGVVAFLTSAVKKTIEFRRELLKLNEVYSMTAKETAIVGGALFGLTNRAGRSRDEVNQLLRAMLDLGQTPKVLEKAGTSFYELSRDILDFSSATSVGLETSAELVDQLVTINKLPYSGIRSIGNALKHVADVSKLTSDELVQFNKTLEPIFAQLGSGSAEAREQFTAQMLGLAGALTNTGIDASKATSQFSNMLNRFSEEGVMELNKLSAVTNIAAEDLRDMIRTNPAQVFDELAKSASKMDPQQLEYFATHLKPLGLGFSELSRLADQATKDEGKFFQKAAAAAAEAAQRESELAKKAAKRQELIAALNAKFEKLWETIQLKVGGAILRHVLDPLAKKLIPTLNKIANWIATVNWGKFFDDLEHWLKVTWRWLKENKELVLGIIAALMLVKLGAVSAFVTMTSHAVKFGGTLLTKIGTMSTGAVGAVTKGIAGISGASALAFGAATVGVGAFAYQVYKHWDGIKYESKAMWKSISSVGGGALDWIGEKLSAVFGTERIQKWKDAVLDAITGWLDGIKDVAQAAINFIKNLWSGKYGEVIASLFDTSEGDSVFDRIKAGFKTLISDNEVKAEPVKRVPSTVGEAIAQAEGAKLETTESGSVQFPNKMTTSSPVLERSMNRLVALNEAILTALTSGGGAGASAAALRHRKVAEITGQ